MSMFRIIAVGVVAASGVLGLGCHTTPPYSPEVGLTQPVNPPRNPDLGRGAPRMETQQTYAIILGEDVPAICSGPSPYFNTAQSKAKGQSEPTMQNLADCMIDGPLRGKSIVLIGHTDPRGSEDYNLKLGAKRANDVRNYLISQGIAPERVTTETAGKATASGDPDKWATDRRVEVQLEDRAAKSGEIEKER